MKEPNESEILQRMAAYCSTAERCIQDVQKKIEQAGLPVEGIERIIARLLKEKFIDEKRFTKSFLNDKLRFNRWGRIKIGYELKKKYIPSGIIRETLDTIDEEEYLNILTSLLAEKKRHTKAKDERELFYKLLRFAASRGFESKESIACLKKLMNGTEYADDLE